MTRYRDTYAKVRLDYIKENKKDRKLFFTSSTDLCPSSHARSETTGENRTTTEAAHRTGSQGRILRQSC